MSALYSVVVSSSGRQPDEQRQWIATWAEDRLRALWPTVPHVCVPGPEPFSHALSFNLGVAAAETPIVVLMDADTTVDVDTMARAVEHVEAHGGWLLTERYGYLSPAATDELLRKRDPRVALGEWVRLRDCEWVGEKVSSAGFLVIHRADFLEHGGYDERLSGWAPDDVGFAVTYANLFADPYRLPGSTVYHLWHPTDFQHGEQGWNDEKRNLMARYLAANGNPKAVREVRFGERALARVPVRVPKGMRRV